jgi:regulator of ribonuclease activity A
MSRELKVKIKTADLCDRDQSRLLIAEPVFRDYGGIKSFSGPIVTVRVYQDNVLVRTAIEESGQGRVLVVDGGGSLHCALVGDLLATLAHTNGWAGIVVNGCVRDVAEIAQIPLGLKALNANPRRSKKAGGGECDVPVTFAGITFMPGQYLYADQDGIVVSARELTLD